MTDTMLEALRAHVKEPEPIDWRFLHAEVSDNYLRCAVKYNKTVDDLIEARAKITRLEQRCAELEGELSRESEWNEHRTWTTADGECHTGAVPKAGDIVQVEVSAYDWQAYGAYTDKDGVVRIGPIPKDK